MIIRTIFNHLIIHRTQLERQIHSSTVIYKRLDLRDRRVGVVDRKEKLEGEGPVIETQARGRPYEFIDENIMDKMIDNVRFKDIPVIHLICTSNNTKMVIEESNRTFIHKSGGTEGFKNCRKGTTVAAQAVAKRVIAFAHDHEIDMARLVFDGLGPGRAAAFKVIELSGIKIVSLSDRTLAIEPWKLRPRKARRV